jgi:cell wall-associated NlpC family hydrolase
MANVQQWPSLITYYAQKYGVDPEAAMAVASVEGLSGGVGDGGHAFGPFQLNDAGGVITGRPGDHRSFAESPAGIEFAMRQIASVAKGLKGEAAVHAIVTQFERPKDPTGEIKNALAVLGKTPLPSAKGPGEVATGMPAPPEPPKFDPKAFATQSLGELAAGKYDPEKTLSALVQAKSKSQQPSGQAGSPLAQPSITDGSRSGVQLVAFAASQVGQPYVWGGSSPGGFDCSGLVDYALRQQGYKGARVTTQNALQLGYSVLHKSLAPGDLIISRNGQHMVIYAGGGKVIAAPHTGTVVQYQPLSSVGGVVDVRRVAH